MKSRKLRDYDKVLQAEYEKGKAVWLSLTLCLILFVSFTVALIIDLAL